MSRRGQAHNRWQQDGGNAEVSAMSEPRRITQEYREEFWRRCGWLPDLPEAERRHIEELWDDESIDMAELFGW
jgi:hypothetical protein